MPHESYIPKKGDIIIQRRKAGYEYSLVHIHGKEILLTIMDHAGLIEWATLGGRFPYEIACSNPAKNKKPPTEILTVAYFGSRQPPVITERKSPHELVAVWNTADAEYKTKAIREFVTAVHQPKTKKDLDEMVSAQMKTQLLPPIQTKSEQTPAKTP